MANPSDLAVLVEDVVMTYGRGAKQINAVDHISFKIRQGEVVG